MAAVFQRFTQAANVDIDRPVFDIDVSPPDVIQQLFAAVDAFRVSHKEVQKFEFCRAHIQRVFAGHHAMRGRVEA
ncbi:hypothetical protein D3C72_2171800 [compost metagenome]